MKIRYVDSGKGEPIVLLHGGTSNLESWIVRGALPNFTLGVVGSVDSALQSMQDLAKLRPDMKFVIVEGASHTGPDGIQGRPELISAIREFIASHRNPGARQAAQ